MYKRYGKVALLVVALGTCLFMYGITQVNFNYVFESFFPTGDPDLEYYQEFRTLFENDNDYLLLGLEQPEGVFSGSFLARADSLCQALQQLPGVLLVASPTSMKQPIKSPAGFIQVPVLHPGQRQRYAADSTRIWADETLMGTFFAKNGRSIAMLIKHDELKDKSAADRLVLQINALLQQYQFTHYHLAGKAKAQGVYVSKMQSELFVFVSASLVLIVLFLFFAYRSLWGIVVPIIVVLLAVAWILGLMGLTGKSLDILLILLPTIMFVVGMSDVVHIITKYIEELRHGAHKLRALRTTLKEVGLATLLTSVTTAVGFLTLFTASIKPIREFGLYTAIGVFLAFVLAFTLLPAVLLFVKKPKVVQSERNRLWWRNKLQAVLTFVFRNRTVVMAVSAVVIGVSLWGINQLRVNSFLIEDIPDNDPLKQDFAFFDQAYAGSRPFEMTVTVLDSSLTVYDAPVMAELEKVHQYLTGSFGAGALLSPLTVFKSMHRTLNGGLQKYYVVPGSPKAYQNTFRWVQRANKRPRTVALATANGRIGRISGRIGDIGSRQSELNNQALMQYIQQNTNTSLVAFKLTGTSLLIDKNNYYLVSNMVKGLGIAFGVIALIAGFMFKSLRMVLITLVPNMIPLLVVAGIMGLTGIDLKLSTSIVFSIAFGIAVDDTIHFISKLRIELGKGRTVLYALKRTYFSTGKAIIITTLILASGFMTLLLSDFGGTYYTGLLVGLTLVFAVLFDLTLLPVLILLFYKQKPKASPHPVTKKPAGAMRQPVSQQP